MGTVSAFDSSWYGNHRGSDIFSWPEFDGRPAILRPEIDMTPPDNETFVTYREFMRFLNDDREQARKERVELSVKIDTLIARIDRRSGEISKLQATVESLHKRLDEHIEKVEAEQARQWSAIEESVVKGGDSCPYVCQNGPKVAALNEWKSSTETKIRALIVIVSLIGTAIATKMADAFLVKIFAK